MSAVCQSMSPSPTNTVAPNGTDKLEQSSIQVEVKVEPKARGHPGNGDEGGAKRKYVEQDRKARHKLVEQSRREKTRALTSELHETVPNLGEFGSNVNMNVVLEGTLEYLRQCNGRRLQDGQAGQEAALVTTQELTPMVPRGVYTGMFGSAPVGIAIAQVSGQVVWNNPLFEHLFGDLRITGSPSPQMAIPGSPSSTSSSSNPKSLFTLTAPESLPLTMKAAAELLTGRNTRVSMVKLCNRTDGTKSTFQVEMNVVHKKGKPAYFCCSVRPTTGQQSLTNGDMAGASVYGAGAGSSAGGGARLKEVKMEDDAKELLNLEVSSPPEVLQLFEEDPALDASSQQRADLPLINDEEQLRELMWDIDEDDMDKLFND